MPTLRVDCLAGPQLDLALPLVRSVAPRISLEEWRAQANDAIDHAGGVIAAFAEDGLVHGVALFQPRTMLRLGRVLQVDDLITMEMSRKAPVHRLLIDTLFHLARSLQCRSLTMAVPADTSATTLNIPAEAAAVPAN